jgi:hypothetical protein
MINAIGEATMQQFVRTSYDTEVFAKDQEIKKTDRINEPRPVEESDDSQKSKMDLQSKDNMKTRNLLVNGQLIVEQYDEDGKLVKKTPPGYLPIGETA